MKETRRGEPQTHRFPNLAGNRGCDLSIRNELTTAGISIITHDEPLKQEVPTSLTGVLTHENQPAFTFGRAWYYWVVSGKVPLQAAEEMYADPVGKKEVRVAGHCGCPPPAEWAFPDQEAIQKFVEEKGLDGINYDELAEACNRGDLKGERSVDTYHIDSQEGLNLFVQSMRNHGLIDPLPSESSNPGK